MKIVSISDFHGKIDILHSLSDAIQSEAPDLIVFTGDIVKGYARGDEYLSAKAENRSPMKGLKSIEDEDGEDLKLYKEFYNFLTGLNAPVFTIPGNMDAPEGRYFDTFKNLNPQNVNLVHNKMAKFEDFTLFGFGGEVSEFESEDFFVLIYPKNKVDDAFKKMDGVEGEKIFLFHTPPVSKVGLEGGAQRGTKVINGIIEKYKPDFVFCGHAHKAQGEDSIGESIIINPGPLKGGNYTVVETEKRKVIFQKF